MKFTYTLLLFLLMALSAWSEDFAALCADRTAVERVYYNHRTGTKPPFEQALPRATLERFVRDDLKKEAVLARTYSVNITDEMVAAEVRRIEEFRQKKIIAAKAALQEAKKSLTDARAKVQGFDGAQKKANAQVKDAEKQKRQAESLLEKATAAYDEAASRAKTAEAEARAAAQAVESAKNLVDEATKDLEFLLRK